MVVKQKTSRTLKLRSLSVATDGNSKLLSVHKIPGFELFILPF